MSLSSEFSRRLNGKYQLDHLKKKKFPLSVSTSKLVDNILNTNPYQCNQSKVYTFPKTELKRYGSLDTREQSLPYKQRIGLAHQSLSSIKYEGAAPFNSSVNRGATSFLKDQIKYFEAVERENRRKAFEKAQLSLLTDNTEADKYQKFETDLPYRYNKIKNQSRNLRRKTKETIFVEGPRKLQMDMF